jgi:hypothetical protein
MHGGPKLFHRSRRGNYGVHEGAVEKFQAWVNQALLKEVQDEDKQKEVSGRLPCSLQTCLGVPNVRATSDLVPWRTVGCFNEQRTRTVKNKPKCLTEG